ncbi:unnamed protein product, partial [marine sediment metagenome]
IDIASRMVKELREEAICDGVHIMTLGREQVLPEILRAAGLGSKM